MKSAVSILAAAAATVVLSAQQRAPIDKASEIDRWWAHVTFLADDGMRGRQTGSPGHKRAAEYVAEQFKKIGLRPGAGTSYMQPVPFVSRRVLEDTGIGVA